MLELAWVWGNSIALYSGARDNASLNLLTLSLLNLLLLLLLVSKGSGCYILKLFINGSDSVVSL